MPSGEKNPNWKGGVSKQPYRYKKIQAQRNPQQIRARRAVHDAVKAGRLVRQCCEVCGDPKTHGHHDDYGKPLEVRWLCNKHHRALHRAIGTPHQ